MEKYIKIHPDDTVAVALRELPAGMQISLSARDPFALKESIPAGHKFALIPIAAGAPVIKYGASIGTAFCDIPQGGWVHTHNLRTGLDGLLTYTYEPVPSVQNAASPACGEKEASSSHNAVPAPACGRESASPHDPAVPACGKQEASSEAPCFQGYLRSDGRAGVRNEIWIIPTVGCVNDVAAAIAARTGDLATGSIDAVAAFSHPYGCSQMGEDQENTRRILADLIRHPNAGGVLVLGLGCENSNIEVLKSYIGDFDPDRVKFLVAQEAEDEIAEGEALVRQLAAYAGRARREPISCRKLIVGLKCGGSDGLSGITANPTVGLFSDILTGLGGTTILTEVPEMFGAETLLMNRCANEELFSRTVTLINDFKTYFTSHGQSIYENPSPGNKKGGISTLEDKSLGCTQKSGSAPVSGVLSYGERVRVPGLNLLSAPGNDLVAATALAASGAQIVLFTTGRGTPFASPVPTVKISSNTPLFEKKRNWIDFNCGRLTEGTPLPQLGQELFDYVLRVAGGERVKSEEAGFHDMAIFKQGVTL